MKGLNKEGGSSKALWVIAILFLIALVGGIVILYCIDKDVGEAQPKVSPPYEVIATVTRVIDSDTIDVIIDNLLISRSGVFENADERVRFGGGIDAPETTPPEPGGMEAAELVENLIPLGTTVYLDLDDEQYLNPDSQGQFRDKYDRLIAVVYAEIGDRWVNVNAEVLRWGQEEYPDHDWLKYVYFISEFDPYGWLAENYPYVLP